MKFLGCAFQLRDEFVVVAGLIGWLIDWVDGVACVAVATDVAAVPTERDATTASAKRSAGFGASIRSPAVCSLLTAPPFAMSSSSPPVAMSDSSSSTGGVTIVAPTVYWAQSATEIWLRLDIKEARKETLKVKVAAGNKLHITATSKLHGQSNTQQQDEHARTALRW